MESFFVTITKVNRNSWCWMKPLIAKVHRMNNLFKKSVILSSITVLAFTSVFAFSSNSFLDGLFGPIWETSEQDSTNRTEDLLSQLPDYERYDIIKDIIWTDYVSRYLTQNEDWLNNAEKLKQLPGYEQYDLTKDLFPSEGGYIDWYLRYFSNDEEEIEEEEMRQMPGYLQYSMVKDLYEEWLTYWERYDKYYTWDQENKEVDFDTLTDKTNEHFPQSESILINTVPVKYHSNDKNVFVVVSYEGSSKIVIKEATAPITLLFVTYDAAKVLIDNQTNFPIEHVYTSFYEGNLSIEGVDSSLIKKVSEFYWPEYDCEWANIMDTKWAMLWVNSAECISGFKKGPLSQIWVSNFDDIKYSYQWWLYVFDAKKAEFSRKQYNIQWWRAKGKLATYGIRDSWSCGWDDRHMCESKSGVGCTIQTDKCKSWYAKTYKVSHNLNSCVLSRWTYICE